MSAKNVNAGLLLVAMIAVLVILLTAIYWMIK
jgi:hypothetical protein